MPSTITSYDKGPKKSSGKLSKIIKQTINVVIPISTISTITKIFKDTIKRN